MKDLKYIYLDKNNKYYFAFKNETVDGQESLIQKIIVMLLTLRGSNEYTPDFGTSFYTKELLTYSSDKFSEISDSITLSIASIKTDVIKEQLNKISLGIIIPDEEYLTDLILDNLIFNKSQMRFELILIIATKANTLKIGI